MDRQEPPKKHLSVHSRKKTVKKPKETSGKGKKGISENRILGTGRRKTSVARVFLVPGDGHISVNGRDIEQYSCGRFVLITAAKKPLEITNTINKFNVFADVSGGGIASQIGALSHGISRALVAASADFRSILKKSGLLSRDSRMKERKKYGHKRARKSFQYSKR